MGVAPLLSLIMLLTSSVVEANNVIRAARKPLKGVMDCGENVQLCGVLALDSGFGRGVYHHEEPSVHGLWPETGRFGDSRCHRPRRSNIAARRIFPCYRRHKLAAAQIESSAFEVGIKPRRVLGFQTHEWIKHGRCAGVKDAEDYFKQVCDLADLPLSLLNEAKKGGGEFVDLVGALQGAGFNVWDADAHEGEIRLSACATPDGQWQLAAQPDFDLICGSGQAGVQSSTQSPDIIAIDSDDDAEGETRAIKPMTAVPANPADTTDSEQAMTQSHPVAAKASAGAAASEGSTPEERHYKRNHSLRRSLAEDQAGL